MDDLSLVFADPRRGFRSREPGELLRPAVVDAYNIGTIHNPRTGSELVSCKRVGNVVEELVRRGHKVTVVFLRYLLGVNSCLDPEILSSFINLDIAEQACDSPYNSRVRIAHIASQSGAFIVSSSQFRNVTDKYPEYLDIIRERLVMPTFAGDMVMLPVDGPLGRHGPDLKYLLRCSDLDPESEMVAEHQLSSAEQARILQHIGPLLKNVNYECLFSAEINQEIETTSFGECTDMEQTERENISSNEEAAHVNTVDKFTSTATLQFKKEEKKERNGDDTNFLFNIRQTWTHSWLRHFQIDDACVVGEVDIEDTVEMGTEVAIDYDDLERLYERSCKVKVPALESKHGLTVEEMEYFES